jgi:hypothetical protein
MELGADEAPESRLGGDAPGGRHRGMRLGDVRGAEAAFKAVGRALRAAVRLESEGVPSTKGLL